MRILITGAAGFLGRRLVAALLARGYQADKLFLADRVEFTPPPGTTALVGELADPAYLDILAGLGCDSVFHLAATLTLEAERDPAAAWAGHVAPVQRLVRASNRPRIVFASSIAVFGGDLPDPVQDDLRQTPTTSYGTQKAIVELLLADHSRRREIDGRALRLPIVLTRPGASLPVVSDQVAAIIREPLAGREVDCPLSPETRIPVASVGAVVRALLALYDLPEAELPPGRAMNLPALTVSIAEMIAALGDAGRLVRMVPDPVTQKVVDGWPKRFVSAHASALGIGADADLAALIADYTGAR
ncbi:NAD-dependent epimerase/dehydratase family protein [Rhodovarius crocodyli]|nr:NAD-dependent epimerase/dehydratase family protein [Rhodovarius crocodyli]